MSSRIWTVSLFVLAASLLMSVGVRHFSLKRISQQRERLYASLEEAGIREPRLLRVRTAEGRQGWRLTSTAVLDDEARTRGFCHLTSRLTTITDFIEISDPGGSAWLDTTFITTQIEDFLPE